MMHIDTATIWTLFGLLGQLLFSGRFLVQWLASERLRRSVVPEAFWYLSMAGGLSLFIYACWRQDPVFMLGQGLGLGVYARNLYLIHGHARARRSGDGPDSHVAGAGAAR